MSPSIRTMGFFMSEINFCNTKEQLNHLGEVVTGKVDGSPSGADIDTSTLPYTGQVRKTLPALEQEYLEAIQGTGGISLGLWTSGVTTFNAYNEYAVYNGIPYKPRIATALPYAAQGPDPTAAPDDANVQPYQEITEAQVVAVVESAIPDELPKYTDLAFDTVALLKSGLSASNAGDKVEWSGYYSLNDGGGNKGVVKSGAHTEDGGIIFSIDSNTYVEADTTEGISVLQFGLIPSDHTTTDRAQAAYNSGVSKIKWPKRDYIIDAVLNGFNGILVKSNTLTVIDAGSTLTAFAPTSNEYSILGAVQQSNVFFYVEGVEFIGDRDTHTGVTGEQGFGIRIGECDRYVIRGGTYRDFWGDGLFIGKFGAPGNPPSTNGYIRGVLCDNNRRQGMSIVVANGLVVEDSKFLNSNGTSPESGVDSEPNLNDLPNYNITFRNCEFSGTGGGFNSPFSDGTSDFHFYKCTFNGKANQALIGDALQFRSDGLHGISTFNECTFNGIVREAENAIFTKCDFIAGDEYLQTVWVFACVNDTVVKLIDCTVLAKGEKRPISEGGSLLPTTAKKFVRTRFIKQGDQGSLFIVNHSSGYSTYTDCELIHQGATPASDFYFNGIIDGDELVIESITGDSFFTVGGQAGRYSTVYPIRGAGSPEGVITAPIGSQFMDSTGSAGNVRFLKESGIGNTGWIAA